MKNSKKETKQDVIKMFEPELNKKGFKGVYKFNARLEYWYLAATIILL